MTPIRLRHLGCRDYRVVYRAMREFTDRRDTATLDELWLTEHPAVFTQGLNGKPEHLLNTESFDLVQSDRGGQVTYHGPGQLVVYVLLDLRRANTGVRTLVTLLEQSVVDLLGRYGIAAHSLASAPGVYIGGRKISSLGLRVRRGCSYHGLSVNVAMDLTPFDRINPCGIAGLQMTTLANFGVNGTVEDIGRELADLLIGRLGGDATVAAVTGLPAAAAVA